MSVGSGDDTRGIVRPDRLGRLFRLERFPPPPPLARFVDRFWTVTWDLAPGRRHEQQVVTHPAVNLVFENGAATLTGVITNTFVRELVGRGRALGVMFRPGGFRPFLDRAMASITDQSLTVGEVFGPPGQALAEEIDLSDMPQALNQVSEFLLERAPPGPTPGEEVSALVEMVASDPSIHSVSQLTARLGVNPRRLQRLFADQVGVSPRWVIQRSRLHAAAEEAARNDRSSWAEVAATLGYSDQAHLTRRFKAAVGEPPARYARRIEQQRSD